MTSFLINSGKKGKGRSFEASLLYYITAPSLMDGGDKEDRPLVVSFAASTQAARAVEANLRRGRVASTYPWGLGHRHDERFRLPTTAYYAWTSQALPDGGVIRTAYVPSWVHVDPGAHDERWVGFVMVPARWWVDAQLGNPALARHPESERREVVVGSLFAAFVARRVPVPILREPSFHAHLYRRAQAVGLLKLIGSDDYRRTEPRIYPRDADPGLEVVAVADARASFVIEFLQVETAKYMETKNGAS